MLNNAVSVPVLMLPWHLGSLTDTTETYQRMSSSVSTPTVDKKQTNLEGGHINTSGSVDSQ